MIDERFPNWDIDVENGEIYSLKLKRYIGAIDKKGYVNVRPQKGYRHWLLHQYIWMVANRCEIPEGYDVHHKDHNRQNNSIYNLELIESTKHRSEHNQNMSEETKKKISESKKGTILTEEHRRKISEAHKGKQLNRKDLSKQVAQYTLDGKLVKVWLSTSECGRNGFIQQSVSSCCQGKLKTHKKFKWKYLNE